MVKIQSPSFRLSPLSTVAHGGLVLDTRGARRGPLLQVGRRVAPNHATWRSRARGQRTVPDCAGSHSSLAGCRKPTIGIWRVGTRPGGSRMHIAHAQCDFQLRTLQRHPELERGTDSLEDATLGRGVVSGRSLGLRMASRLTRRIGTNPSDLVCIRVIPDRLPMLGCRVGPPRTGRGLNRRYKLCYGGVSATLHPSLSLTSGPFHPLSL